MRLLKCPKCGEMFSDTYKTCPFCQEDEELHSGKHVKTGGRRVGGAKARPKVGGGVVVACLVLVLGSSPPPGAKASSASPAATRPWPPFPPTAP